jgi:hypothetical protein
MDTYDPDIAPDPRAWLELDEGERLLLVGDYHEQAGDELPNVQIHAAIHVVVENQLAEAYLPAVEALERLMREGLNRHDSVHAIGSVLTEQIWTQTQGDGTPAFPSTTYEQELRALTADRWRERYGKTE